MDLAMAYERLWFRIFDPALAEATPPLAAECFSAAALAHGPLRCSGFACPATATAPRRRRANPAAAAEQGWERWSKAEKRAGTEGHGRRTGRNGGASRTPAPTGRGRAEGRSGDAAPWLPRCRRSKPRSR